MKLNKSLLIMALSLFSVSGVFAEQKAKKDEVPGVAAQPASYFYTGKPYDADLGAYTFNYRNYDPELQRWTSVDPSGFPDGANSQIYAPIPTNSIDPLGLNTTPVTKVIDVSYGWYQSEMTNYKWDVVSATVTNINGESTNQTVQTGGSVTGGNQGVSITASILSALGLSSEASIQYTLNYDWVMTSDVFRINGTPAALFKPKAPAGWTVVSVNVSETFIGSDFRTIGNIITGKTEIRNWNYIVTGSFTIQE